MKLSDVIEEIIEKTNTTLPERSLIRKVNQLRNQLIREYSTDLEVFAWDLMANLAQYPLPCSKGNVRGVVVNECDFPLKVPDGFQSHYYYFLHNTLGIYPTPSTDIKKGLKIFAVRVPDDLTENDMNAETGFDPDYDMVLVFGVSKEITEGNKANEYMAKYQESLKDYLSQNASWETDVIKERW